MISASRLTIEPRGLQRMKAAGYVGISPTKFDEMVLAGRMPKPRLIDRRKVWDRVDLDAAFEALPTENEENSWDDLLTHGQN